jgi:transcription antitermination factor NusG
MTARVVNGETVVKVDKVEKVDPRELPVTVPFDAVTWYVLVTDSHRQRAAVELLRARGVQTVAPLVHLKRRRWARARRALIKTPLLPDYIIAGFDAVPRWLELLGLGLLRGVVGTAGQPLAVPPAQAALFYSHHGMTLRPGRAVTEGGMVQLLDGPFLHRWATVETIHLDPDTGDDRADLLIELFGREVALRGVELDILEAA